MKVFLGGTCNGSDWRERAIPLLEEEGLEYFNPIVEDWTKKEQEREIEERQNCDFCLYTITPKAKGVYSVAELISDSIKRPEKTVFVLLESDGKDRFDKGQMKSWDMVKKMVEENGAKYFEDLVSAVMWIAKINEIKGAVARP